MKKQPFFLRSLLLAGLILCAVLKSEAQNYINIKVGAGIPEMPGASVGLQASQVQLLVGAGIIPISDNRITTITGDLFFHLLGSSDKSELRPWYARTGLCFFKEETERWIDRYRYWDIRIGRSMIISERMAVELDLGLVFELSYNREEIDPASWGPAFTFPVLPALGTRFVYRFGLDL